MRRIRDLAHMRISVAFGRAGCLSHQCRSEIVHVSVGAAHGCRGVDRCNRQSDERCSTVDFSAAGSQVLDEQLLGLGLRHPRA